jgi:hypothetical protein
MFGTYEKPSDLSQLLPQAWQIIWSLGPNGCTSRTLGGGEEDERNEQRTPRRDREAGPEKGCQAMCQPWEVHFLHQILHCDCSATRLNWRWFLIKVSPGMVPDILYACMYDHVCTHTHICIYINIYLYLFVYLSIHPSIHLSVYCNL